MGFQAEQILQKLLEFKEGIEWEFLLAGAAFFAVFCALNCFFGYRLRKVWSCLLGILAGGVAGAGAGVLLFQDKILVLACGAAGALILGLLAWVLYKLGVFVMCGGLAYGMVIALLPEPDAMQYLIALVVWVFAGTLALGYEKQVVIAITAFCGAYGAIHMLFYMTKIETRAGELLLALVLGCIGAAAQAFPFFRGKDLEGRLSGIFSGGGGKKKSQKRRKADRNQETARPMQRQSQGRQEEGWKRRQPAQDRSYAAPYEGTEAQRRRSAAGESLERERRESQRDLDNTRVFTGYEPGLTGEGNWNRKPGMPVSELDLDDLNRELSKEIQKIYNEDNPEEEGAGRSGSQ